MRRRDRETGGSEERSKEELSLYDCSLYGDISPRVVRDFKVSLCDRDEQ